MFDLTTHILLMHNSSTFLSAIPDSYFIRRQIGRPVVWGLAVAGEEGVSYVLEMLRSEFELAMALCGCVKVSDIKRELVIRDAFAPYDVRRTLPSSKI